MYYNYNIIFNSMFIQGFGSSFHWLGWLDWSDLGQTTVGPCLHGLHIVHIWLHWHYILILWFSRSNLQPNKIVFRFSNSFVLRKRISLLSVHHILISLQSLVGWPRLGHGSIACCSLIGLNEVRYLLDHVWLHGLHTGHTWLTWHHSLHTLGFQ
jgi:hypothetical protein